MNNRRLRRISRCPSLNPKLFRVRRTREGYRSPLSLLPHGLNLKELIKDRATPLMNKSGDRTDLLIRNWGDILHHKINEPPPLLQERKHL
jgi:hypothetical protein